MTAIVQSVLRYFAEMTGNYAYSIIIFTVILRIALFPLSISQTRTMEKQKKIQPLVDEVQKKYKGQPEEINRRVMEIYKQNNFNLLSGCLPALLTLPIMLLFYRGMQDMNFMQALVNDGISMRFLWIADIMKHPKVVIPANITDLGGWLLLAREMIMPLITAGSTYLTFAMTSQPSSGSNNSMAMFKWLWPVMFGYFALVSAQSLVIYWVAFNIINLIQQWIILKFIVKPA
ncbi:MAG TPA: YidC/Oxa1 family membrane protein insertase [Bacillota bacterium]|nr:membrane protein insertase YidC [Bacillota bacterium]HOA15339.1 YidC/Oxa1 family membrane protein insertase [Bacillota bacterium]HOG52290.1 YidC/Oxa1 family membrane protein insertase [Bacillota bacterium]